MRRFLARLLAALTGIVIVALLVLFALLQNQPQAGSQDETLARIARGKEVYVQQKCQACHSIDGVGSRRSPLDGVGSRRTVDELRLWIVDPRKMRPTVRKPDYRAVPKEDVDAMVAYLATLEDE